MTLQQAKRALAVIQPRALILIQQMSNRVV
jgi:hypothetical protein